MEHILYWLWLTLKGGATPTRIEMLLERFGSVEAVYSASDYSEVKELGARLLSELTDKRLTKAVNTVERAKKAGVEIVVYDSDDYPDILRNIPRPPCVLYIKGELLDWNSLFTIAVVGTRRLSTFGKTVTRGICSEFARRGVTVVSGMAEGIDAAAAWAALDEGGKTIAVLGSGIDVIYPKSNTSLYYEICRNGCVISEYPPGMPPSRWSFPERNRIIAGLSKGVLVTEAPEKSGSLITAREALHIGRRLFAVPGDVFNDSYVGDKNVIQLRAKLVNRAVDVLSDFGVSSFPKPVVKRKTSPVDIPVFTQRAVEAVRPATRSAADETPKPEVKKKMPDDKDMTDDERAVAKLLLEKSMTANEIARALDKPVSKVNITLTMLELSMIVKRLPGNRFEIK